MAYTVRNTNNDIVATVADSSVDSTTNIRLIGKNYVGYGTALNENLIALLENFASDSAPNKPIKGQLWYDTSTYDLKIYNGSSFGYATTKASNLVVTGNISTSNASVSGLLNVTGTLSAATISATTFNGNLAGNVTGNLSGNVTGNFSGNVSATNITGTINTASQPNITSLGNLTTLTVAGSASLSTTSGAVGIGTDTPDSGVKLDVRGTGTTAVLQVTGSGMAVARIESATNGNVTVMNQSNGSLRFAANNNVYMTVTADGNIGIGNANPTNTLRVQGNASVSSFLDIAANASVGTTLVVTANANVGNLNSSGTANVTSTATVGNLSTAGNVSATGTLSVTGNANVGNLGTSLIVATSTITGGNLSTGGNISATGTLSITSNANVGNLGTSGIIVATGNITAGNLLTGGTANITGNANVGNLGTGGIIVATGNITGGNLLTGGNVSAANVIGTHYGSGAGITANTIPASALQASGTANSSSFFRGDGSWVVISTAQKFNYLKAFTSGTTNWTVPAGVTTIRVFIAGGGGGEGFPWCGTNGPNMPGGWGGYAEGVYTVTAGQTLTAVVGAAGLSGNATGGNGGAGGTSSLTGTGVSVTATGGTGGYFIYGPNQGYAGTNGVGSGGTLWNTSMYYPYNSAAYRSFPWDSGYVGYGHRADPMTDNMTAGVIVIEYLA